MKHAEIRVEAKIDYKLTDIMERKRKGLPLREKTPIHYPTKRKINGTPKPKDAPKPKLTGKDRAVIWLKDDANIIQAGHITMEEACSKAECSQAAMYAAMYSLNMRVKFARIRMQRKDSLEKRIRAWMGDSPNKVSETTLNDITKAVESDRKSVSKTLKRMGLEFARLKGGWAKGSGKGRKIKFSASIYIHGANSTKRTMSAPTAEMLYEELIKVIVELRALHESKALDRITEKDVE